MCLVTEACEIFPYNGRKKNLFKYQFTNKYGCKSISHLTWKHHSSCIPVKWDKKRYVMNTKCGSIKQIFVLDLQLQSFLSCFTKLSMFYILKITFCTNNGLKSQVHYPPQLTHLCISQPTASCAFQPIVL